MSSAAPAGAGSCSPDDALLAEVEAFITAEFGKVTEGEQVASRTIKHGRYSWKQKSYDHPTTNPNLSACRNYFFVSHHTNLKLHGNGLLSSQGVQNRSQNFSSIRGC